MPTTSDSTPEAAPLTVVKIEDYGDALVHLAWYRADQSRFLMFGLVELYPAEFPSPSEIAEQNLPLRRLGRRNYLYAKRIRMTAKAAVDWYVRCIGGTIELPGDFDSRGNPKFLAAAGFVQEPRWPHLIAASDTYPFVSQFWQYPRMHHLLQPELLPEAKAAVQDTEGQNWLSEQMFVDFETYAELRGCLHLVAPNPVLRSVDHRLSTQKPQQQEASVLRFQTRNGKSVEGLRILLIDRRPTGIGSCTEIEVSATEMEVLHPPGTTGEMEMILRNPDRSLLAWSKPSGFIQSVSVNMMLPGTRQEIVVPGTTNSPQSSYLRELAGPQTTVTVGEARSPREAISLLAAGDARRELKNLDVRYPERWFHGEEREAAQFVRDLIANARQRLWIVDPYFTTVELIRFALSTSSTKLPVHIVTSSEAMTKKDRIDPTRTAAEVLDAQLPNLAKHGNFTISVLTGSPAVHDRFLVIDDCVWFSGNSLHTIGDRAGMIVRLRDSQDLLTNLEQILASDRAANWHEWFTNWRETKTQSRGIGPGVVAAVGLVAGIVLIGFYRVLRGSRSGRE